MEAIREDYMKSRQSWFLYFILIVITLILIISSLYHRIHFPAIREKFLLKITSNYPITQERDWSQKTFWEVNLEEMRKELLASSFIKKAEVKLVVPNQLYINLVPRIGVALWWDYKKFYSIDREGFIIEEVINKGKGQVLVLGEGALEEFEIILPLLESTKLAEDIVSIRFIGHRRWDLLLKNGTLIKLPEKEIKKALDLFIKLSNKALINKNNVIDMRLAPHKIFIKNVQDKR